MKNIFCLNYCSLFLIIGWKYDSIDSGQALVLNGWQIITWTNVMTMICDAI